MPETSPIPGSAEEWLARARADLALAGAPLPPGGVYADLCFHAQQAAEKALKAVYQRYGWTFRYVHDLKELLAGLRDQGLVVPEDLDEAARLTAYAQESRYPGVGEPVTVQERDSAVTLAETVLRWAQSHIPEGAP